MKSEGIIIGIWSRWENNGRWGSVVVEKTYQGKTKRYMLKVIGEQRCSEMDLRWEESKLTEVKFTYGLSELSEYNGREFASNPIIFGFNAGGGEPQQEQRMPDRDAMPHQVEEDDDSLPF